ncbi:glycosyltransferase [Ketobacter sp.]
MKALQVYRTYFPDPPGGLQEVIRQIGLGASKLGVDTRIFTLSPDPEPACLYYPEGDVIRSRETIEIASCNISLTCLPEFRRQVEWADVVHYHFPWPFADVLHMLGQVRKPTILTYHSDIVRQQGLLKLYYPLMIRFLDSMDVIVATSQNYVDSSPLLQRFQEKVSVVPIGICDQAYLDSERLPQKPELPARFQSKGYFLFVGMLRYYKGLHFLLDALAGSDTHCVVVGTGPEEQALKQQAGQLGLGNLHFTGSVDDATKRYYFENCKGVVFPSHLRSEAYGVTLLEGAVYGKPLISCEIGTGTSFVNIHNESGLVISPEDPLALRSAMELLDRDEALRKRLGAGARRRYERLFTGEEMGQKYATLYRQLLESV